MTLYNQGTGFSKYL